MLLRKFSFMVLNLVTNLVKSVLSFYVSKKIMRNTSTFWALDSCLIIYLQRKFISSYQLALNTIYLMNTYTALTLYQTQFKHFINNNLFDAYNNPMMYVIYVPLLSYLQMKKQRHRKFKCFTKVMQLPSENTEIVMA